MVRILFFGTPEIAAQYLRALAGKHQIVGVVTQPDRPAQRGYQLQPPAVKVLAGERGFRVFQPEKFTPEVTEELRSLQPELGVVVSYGRLIPESVFTMPEHRCFNVHFSLLPKYRGAAPVQWALINGERETGVSTFWIEKSLDTGPVIVQKAIPVGTEDTSGTLFEKLIPLGIDAMLETISLVAEGKGAGSPQQGEPSYAPTLKRDDGRIDWTRPAKDILNRLRGTHPWPGSFSLIAEGKMKGRRLKILRAGIVKESSAGCAGEAPACGRIAGVVKNAGFTVRCADGLVLVEEVHPENKKPMPAWSFWQSGALQQGDRLE